MRKRMAILAVLLLAVACGEKLAGQCDESHACDAGLTCVTGGVCAKGCSVLNDGGDCAPGMQCRATGIFCQPGEACPALAIEVCLWPDGGS